MLKNAPVFRRAAVLLIALAVLGVAGVVGLGQGASLDPPVQATRTLSTGYALPDGLFKVTLQIEANQDLSGVGINEVLPRGWTIHPLENDGAAFKRAQGQWVFDETLPAGAKREITYEVSVPSAADLMLDFLPDCVSLSGTIQAKVPSVEVPIGGDASVEVVSGLPIRSAIAHLVPASGDALDAIDLRLSQVISKSQFERALGLWRTDLSVPGTEGKLIDLDAMKMLVAYYETCTPVDLALPRNEDPGLSAVRTISTFLPEDSVLLPQGCLDPGLNARRFTVTVDITVTHDAYGIGLKEWIPDGWSVAPIKHEGFSYRASKREWIYPKRLAAGDTLQVVYQVEVLPSVADRLDSGEGCCGRLVKLAGTVSTDLACSEQDVTGEATIHVWNCLPVILAISRWDPTSDTLDVSLSDTISFPQVQRAIAFWSTEEPVPYTCGYTVGYETLKAIVAYWLTHTPVTKALPDAPMEPCCGPVTGCSTPPDTSDWFCRMELSQPPTDRVGVPPSQPPVVDAGADRTLTCSIQEVTLTASVKGDGPYTYEWVNPIGATIAKTASVTVSAPGTYTVIVTSCGGCQGVDTVAIKRIPDPTVSVSPAYGELTCSTTSLRLTASVSGGEGPFSYRWSRNGNAISGATGAAYVVTSEGSYAVRVIDANGCTGTSTSVSIGSPPPPTVTVSPSSGTLTCKVESIPLTATVTGGKAPFAYQWIREDGKTISGATGATYVVTSEGSYAVRVIDANGCTANSVGVHIAYFEDPTVSVSPTSAELSCKTTSVPLTATVDGGEAPFSYQWTKGGEAISGATGATYAATNEGSYAVRVTDANGCTADSLAIPITYFEDPTVSVSPTSGELTCKTTSITLTATVSGGKGPFCYQWAQDGKTISGATSAAHSATSGGTYSVTVTDANGCTAFSRGVSVAYFEDPTVTVSPTSGELTCKAKRVLLTASASKGETPYGYQWTKDGNAISGATGATYAATTSGTYAVTVTDANGCTANSVGVHIAYFEDPTVSVSPTSGELTCKTTSITLTATVSGGKGPFCYQWFKDGLPISGASGGAYAATSNGSYTVAATDANGCTASSASIPIAHFESPTVTVSPASGELTCETTSITLTATVNGGKAPLSYKWTKDGSPISGATGATYTATSKGTYAVRVTDANGCTGTSGSASIAVALPPAVTVSPTSGELSCTTTSITLTATVSDGKAPFSYQWSKDERAISGATGATYAATKDGSYAVSVTDANGCTATSADVSISYIPNPTVTVSPSSGELSCTTTSITLTATVSDGKAPFCYQWTRDGSAIPGATSATYNATKDGSYAVTVTDANGCTVSSTSVSIEKIPDPSVTVSPTSGELTCLTTSIDLTATARGGKTPYAYQWYKDTAPISGATGALYSATDGGSFSVMVTDANGCTASDMVRVTVDRTPPAVEAVADGILTCTNHSVALSAGVSGGTGPFTYEWTDASGKVLGACPELPVDMPGSYTVTVTGANGCSGSDTVTVKRNIAAPSVQANADGILTCANAEVLLSATVSDGSSPFSYVWTDKTGKVLGTCSELRVEAPGSYTVTVTGSNGCSGSDTVTVTQNITAPSVQATSDGELTCAHGEVTLSVAVSGGTAPFMTVWRDAQGNRLGASDALTVVAPGTYTVTVTGANGCSGSDSVIVREDKAVPSVAASADGILTCANREVTLSATVSGGTAPFMTVWRDDQGNGLGTSDALTVATPGTYTVTVTGANGCFGSDSVIVEEDKATPSVQASADGTLTCVPREVQLIAEISGGRPPYTIVWLDEDGNSIGTSATIAVSEPGVYLVSVVGMNGCCDSDQVTVTEDIAAPAVDAGPDQQLSCAHPRALIDAMVTGGAPPYTYSWANECGEQVAATQDITVARSGLYMLTVTGSNGCSATDSVRVTSTIDPPTVDAGPDQVLTCDTPEILLDATVTGGAAPYTYQWTDACGDGVGTTEDLAVSLPGVYTLTVRTADGCVGSDSVEVTEETDGAPATL